MVVHDNSLEHLLLVEHRVLVNNRVHLILLMNAILEDLVARERVLNLLAFEEPEVFSRSFGIINDAFNLIDLMNCFVIKQGESDFFIFAQLVTLLHKTVVVRQVAQSFEVELVLSLLPQAVSEQLNLFGEQHPLAVDHDVVDERCLEVAVAAGGLRPLKPCSIQIFETSDQKRQLGRKQVQRVPNHNLRCHKSSIWIQHLSHFTVLDPLRF